MSVRRALMAGVACGALAVGCGGEAADCRCPAAPPRGCVYTGRAGCACAAMVCSDIGPAVDVGDAVADAGGRPDGDGPRDAGADSGRAMDAGTDADSGRAVDAGTDAGTDADSGRAMDAGTDAGAGVDGGAGLDAAVDRPAVDAGQPPCALGPLNRGCTRDDECAFGIYTQNCVGEQRAVGYNRSAATEMAALQMCWARAFAGVPRCSDRPSRGVEVEQTGRFVLDPALGLGASCMAGRCVALAR